MISASRGGRAQRGGGPEVSAHGQAITSRALLSLAGWDHLDSPQWPGRAGEVVDHLAVGPGGVLVVDTVRLIGRPATSPDRFETAARQLRSATNAIATALPVRQRLFVRPVLCLVADEPVEDGIGGVQVCSTANIASLCSTLPEVLSVADVVDTVDLVRSWQQPTGWLRRLIGS